MEHQKLQAGNQSPSETGQCRCLQLLTAEGLARALQTSLRTVERLLADGEISAVRIGGRLVRFYLPDVLRELRAASGTSKRGCARREGSAEATKGTERTQGT
jgi:excisionase family DNA binding protein